MTDLQDAYAALSNKYSPYKTLYDYAEGDQPLKYSTERLMDAFRNLTAKFQENWCAVVIDATDDRLDLQGWSVKDKAKTETLKQAWNKQRIFLDADDAHRDALITGEGFIIAWKEGETLDVYCNDPRMCHVFYDPARPKVKRFAAKWWSDGANWFMTLYYPDRLEYYMARGKDTPQSPSAFEPMEPTGAKNPFGVIPVFHFRGPGELTIKITALQDAINKLLADMMVSAEFGAFKQRWIISNGADMSAIKNAPYETWIVPGGDGQGQQTSVGQFDATPLENFTKSMDRFAASIAVISRTPKHYFYNSGSNLSGEALMAMEAPLTKKVDKYKERFGVTWQELGAFLLKLAGGGEVDPSDITPIWQPAESVQPLTEAQIIQTETSAGIPLVTAMKRRGASEEDVASLETDIKQKQEADARMAPLLLEKAKVQSEQSNDNNPATGNSKNNQE